MFDRLYAEYSKRKKRTIDPSYGPTKAILRRELKSADAGRLAVIFPGWHGGGDLYQILGNRLARKGWAVLTYEFHDQIMTADEESVVESFVYMQKEIAEELGELTTSNAYREVHFLGVSLGNVVMTMVTKKFPSFSGATIVLAGDDLAVDMWHGAMTQDIRKAFEHERIGIRRLAADWSREAPGAYARDFAGKPVTAVVSTSDRVVRTEYQQRMVQDLSDAGAKVSVRTTRLGHALSIAWFCLLGPLPNEVERETGIEPA